MKFTQIIFAVILALTCFWKREVAACNTHEVFESQLLHKYIMILHNKPDLSDIIFTFLQDLCKPHAKLYANKAFLSSISPVFQAMFGPCFEESQGEIGKPFVSPVVDASYRTFAVLLRYIHTASSNFLYSTTNNQDKDLQYALSIAEQGSIISSDQDLARALADEMSREAMQDDAQLAQTLAATEQEVYRLGGDISEQQCPVCGIDLGFMEARQRDRHVLACIEGEGVADHMEASAPSDWGDIIPDEKENPELKTNPTLQQNQTAKMVNGWNHEFEQVAMKLQFFQIGQGRYPLPYPVRSFSKGKLEGQDGHVAWRRIATVAIDLKFDTVNERMELFKLFVRSHGDFAAP
ncbi:hypothetical protein BT69DRAFT_1300452 [Atractiella rhizophila]|nr:hypothetical protein BT69DRAFT_1300452 [Atractiella rhizophila]